jgi:hypothetical protein
MCGGDDSAPEAMVVDGLDVDEHRGEVRRAGHGLLDERSPAGSGAATGIV